MSIFNELIPKIKEISNSYTKGFNDDLEVAFKCIDKFEEEFQNGKVRATGGREKAHKDKIGMTNLQCINEDDVEPNKQPVANQRSSKSSENRSSSDSNENKRGSKKRSKNEVDDMLSPEVDKRRKRTASVKAQTKIAKQVNMNLTAKMRREQSNDKAEETNNRTDKTQSSLQSKSRRKDDEKENSEPNVPAIPIKTEKISVPPEQMETDTLLIDIPIKQELNKDDMAMPPPAIPVPKPRKALAKKSSEDSGDENGRRRTTRTKKQTEAMPPPPPPPASSARATRASSRTTRPTNSDVEEQPVETRPKRTRAKKKVSLAETKTNEGSQSSQEIVSPTSSPAEKPRTKRTRRGKAAEKQPPKPVEPIILKTEKVSIPGSPILPSKEHNKPDLTHTTKESTITINSSVGLDKLDGTELEETKVICIDKTSVKSKNINKTKDMEKTKIITKDMDQTVIISKDMDKTTIISNDLDKTVVLPNGVYNHAPITPKEVVNMNETMVIQKDNKDTAMIDKTKPAIMDCTVVIEKGLKTSNLTEDNSLLTDDESEPEIMTPPRKGVPQAQPLSAVKEKVQQFEEMATRVTRTKTRAMVKKDEQTDTQTPPDKIIKPVLSTDTLTKMNSLIFNGKPTTQISSSATKPRALPNKLVASASTSKLTAMSRHREAAEEEDARKKKGAMLDAKRELQKRKREEKMAAAAAARCQAERDRRAQLEAAAKERMEKQAHADAGKLERLKETERKKQELARKVAETEERRKAEEAARMQRLADEQRKAVVQRRKQQEEQEAMKKEAALMAKEIEKRQREYIEKQKIKSRIEDKIHTPLKTPGTPGYHKHHHLDAVCMVDGFQYLNSDEDEEPAPRPVPEWSTSKNRKLQLEIQAQTSAAHVERLFSVRTHTPDLRDIFPNIERARLKRTSSAVWRTPPTLRTVCE